MSELVDFLTARLDEDEAVARAATPGPWEAFRRHTGDGFLNDTFGVCQEAAGDVDDDVVSDPGLLPADAEHIAAHDPARVLREVTAKRTILALHSPESNYSHDADGFEHYFTECKTCGPWADPGDPEKDYPCPTVRALAAPFCDHPDFQEQWR